MSEWGLLMGEQSSVLAQAQQRLPGWLSSSEQQRLATLSGTRQAMFLACRYALRLLLAESESQIENWSLTSVADQAPRVRPKHEYAAVPMLSLSHSGNWFACVKAPVAVGVDIEIRKPTRSRNATAMAELVCAPAERKWLTNLTPENQQRGFLELWCLKEAYYKFLGTGVDLASMCHVSWEKIPFEIKQANDLNVMVAHGKTWQGIMSNGDEVYLALCAKQKLPMVSPALMRGESIFNWRNIAEWQLFAVSAVAGNDNAA